MSSNDEADAFPQHGFVIFVDSERATVGTLTPSAVAVGLCTLHRVRTTRSMHSSQSFKVLLKNGLVARKWKHKVGIEVVIVCFFAMLCNKT